ncbi:hypothetical protein APHWI1_1189 [Anaplasma phagocytophilum str. ApWI1]|nr:hypothetical protein [Anaplasma phagocytophilum]AGR79223.1 hypothetical protein YYU_00910 [Anaplasma phagocytophilum str. HZ2]AGR80468.1 hypothetical protein WSQ_00900 [Anaplasma phagocytophilum str. JM]AGR81726.1 hypothetical protein YYY_00915 [Anaplasma phagocytophilum str. Dog2]EOA61772.1 hypothetical protein HGE1_00810 [Anaplasma phagocytophilum str. HGE1]KDB56695.1 hypothetical protein O997_00955 [Anaplasma phagocytophilum str. MRK]KJV85616.1 hypothetical protein APHWI1_1189 [Anaplasm
MLPQYFCAHHGKSNGFCRYTQACRDDPSTRIKHYISVVFSQNLLSYGMSWVKPPYKHTMFLNEQLRVSADGYPTYAVITV